MLLSPGKLAFLKKNIYIYMVFCLYLSRLDSVALQIQKEDFTLAFS